MTNKKETRYGLILDLGGAPPTAHVVVDLPGIFRSDVPRPVGHEGELSLDAAKHYDESDSYHLKLVEIDESKVDEYHQILNSDLKSLERALPAARKAARTNTALSVIEEQSRAIKTTKPTTKK